MTAIIVSYTMFFIYQTEKAFAIVIAVLLLMRLHLFFDENKRHNYSEGGIGDYNQELNELADLLKDQRYNLYDKMKIKQLINKYVQSIGDETKIFESRSSKVKEFVLTFVSPIVAFFAGSIDKSNYTNAQWMSTGIIIVVFIIVANYAYSSISELFRMLKWDNVEKKKELVKKLQDLLDRDFIIENDDLIVP